MKLKRLFTLAIVLSTLLSVYQVGPTSASGLPPSGSASVTAHKFEDTNGNGVQDEGEVDLAGWLFRLYLLNGGIVQVAEGTTDGNGFVTFDDVPPGQYKVWEEMPECWAATTPGGDWNGGHYVVVDLVEGQQAEFKFGNVHTCEPPPAPETCIDLEKAGPETAAPGDTVTYHFLVKNCGDVVLKGGAQVYDPLFGDDPIWDGDLEPEEVVEFDKTYDLPSDHCGGFTNDAWAVGHPPDYPEVRDDDSWTIDIVCGPEPSPSIDVEKYVSTDDEGPWHDADTPAEALEVVVGSDVYFRFEVENTGNVELTNITLNDDRHDVSGCTLTDPLAPDASFECVIGPFTALEGLQWNTATATGDYDGETYEDTDIAKYYGYHEVAPSIEVDKTADPTSVDEPGGEVEFTVRVTNTSEEAVTLTSLLDDVHGDLNGQGTCSVEQEIAAGEYYECSFSAGVIGDAGDSETDTVTATAEDGEGNEVEAEDDATVTITDVPSEIEVDKTADPTEVAEPGGEVEFTVRVDNTSAVDSVTIDSLTDTVYGDLNGQGDCAVPQTIPAGGYYECSFSATVSGEAGDSETDVVTASGTDDDGNPVSDSDDATVTITSGEWDKSSLRFTSGCEGDCEEISATVCNGEGSEDMQGPTTWELYWITSGNPKNGVVIASGTINALARGQCQTLTYDPGDNPNGASGNYMFKAYQRPGHPGEGVLWSNACELECETEPVVYVVISIDTENGDICWYPTHECRNDPNPLFDTHHYKYSDPEASTIFSEDFRNSHVDSFGNSFKMSWFAEMDHQFEAATYLDEGPDFPEFTGQPVGYTGVMDVLQRYWGDEIEQFGDGIYWHHHVQAWTGSTWARNDAVINGYTHHFDALNDMLIDRAYFPSVYRAGWLWEDSNINTFLNDWIPFDYSANSGAWEPYHPNVSNPWSSAAPSQARWMTRSDGGVNQGNVNTAFAHAQSNGAAIYSFYFHDRDNMPGYINSLQSALETAATNYDGVQFKYVNALDAIQGFLGYADRTPPELSITHLDASTYEITSDEPVWQDTPYVAAKYVGADSEYYEHVAVTPAGSNTWQATIPSQITFTPPPQPPVQYHPVGVTASGEHTAAGGAATNAIDGDSGTYWDSAIDLSGGGHGGQVPAWIQLELADVESVASLDIHFYDGDSRQYTYGVEASTDGTTWSQVVPAGTVVHGLATHEFDPPVELRYVRITVTDNTVNDWAHIREIRLYGPASLIEVRPIGADASSWHAPDWPAANAIDDNDATWWDSGYVENGEYFGQVPAWLEVDLGEVRDISRFSIHFYDNDERSYEYSVQASTDGVSWIDLVAPAVWGQGTVVHELTAPTAMRYLHIDVTGGTTGNPHGEFAHIVEVRFYAEGGSSESETLYLEKVGVGASDLYGNPGVALHEVQRGGDLGAAANAKQSPLQRAAPVAAGAAVTTGLASVAWWLLRRKLLGLLVR